MKKVRNFNSFLTVSYLHLSDKCSRNHTKNNMRKKQGIIVFREEVQFYVTRSSLVCFGKFINGCRIVILQLVVK